MLSSSLFQSNLILCLNLWNALESLQSDLLNRNVVQWQLKRRRTMKRLNISNVYPECSSFLPVFFFFSMWWCCFFPLNGRPFNWFIILDSLFCMDLLYFTPCFRLVCYVYHCCDWLYPIHKHTERERYWMVFFWFWQLWPSSQDDSGVAIISYSLIAFSLSIWYHKGSRNLRKHGGWGDMRPGMFCFTVCCALNKLCRAL